MNGSPVDPFDSVFDNLGDAAAWQWALERAAAPDPVVPYLKTDEERALDAEDWAIYANQNQRAQREVSDRAEAGRRALTKLHRLSTTQRRQPRQDGRRCRAEVHRAGMVCHHHRQTMTPTSNITTNAAGD